MSKLRIGIDVGGTFTHAVAIENETLEILDYAVCPTTHNAEEGVARGVIDVFLSLLAKLKSTGTTENDVVFVAHSTTQATNALLEGDVSPVGIIAVGTGIEGVKSKMDADIPSIEVVNGKFIVTCFRYLDTAKDWSEKLNDAVSDLVKSGARSIVACEAFSVDDPRNEIKIKEAANSLELPACGTFEMSGLYGLRVRARTAVVNASILPKMMDTANLTERSLKKASVTAPLMIMRSDGGVMTLSEMKNRPLLTLLSGPAAGIAAALTYIRATDAIFLEVGGTSTDISVIRNGKAMIRSAQIGGHQTYMKTLDSRTLGVAGGSLIRIENRKICEVGPRSAHIAGMPYISFTDPELLEGALEVSSVKPLSDDPAYLILVDEKNRSYAVTTTCAANMLDLIKKGDYAFGNVKSIEKAFNALAAYFNKTPQEIATEIMEKAVDKILPAIQTLIKEYELGEKQIRLIGGGGGAYAIVPYLARKMKTDYEIAKNAEVISAIGAALAMVRETIEKNIFNPKPEDIEIIRLEAEKSVINMGASPESVEVHMEVDGQKNIVRAIATGSIEFKSQDLKSADIGSTDRLKIAASMFGVSNKEVELKDETDYLFIYEVKKTEGKLWNLIKSTKKTSIVMDNKGTVKLQVPNGKVKSCKKDSASLALKTVLEENRVYGDAGSISPSVFVVYGKRLMDLSSVVEEEQILSLARTELEKVGQNEKIIIITKKNI